METLRITLVEDSPIFCFLFRKNLEAYPKCKITLQEFENGVEAMKYFVDHSSDPDAFPHILFVDINMPLMNGFELLDNLVEKGFTFIHEIPVYIVSSSDMELDKNKSLEYPFIKEYIVKPIDGNKVFQLLDEYFNT